MLPDLTAQGFSILPATGVTTSSKKGDYVAIGRDENVGMVQVVVVGKTMGNPVAYMGRLRAAGLPVAFVGRSELAVVHGERRPRYKFWSLIFKIESAAKAA